MVQTVQTAQTVQAALHKLTLSRRAPSMCGLVQARMAHGAQSPGHLAA